MTTDKLVGIRAIIHDRIQIMGIVAHVDFDHQALRIVRHKGFFIAGETHIKPYSIRFNLFKELKISVGNTQFRKTLGLQSSTTSKPLS